MSPYRHVDWSVCRLVDQRLSRPDQRPTRLRLGLGTGRVSPPVHGKLLGRHWGTTRFPPGINWTKCCHRVGLLVRNGGDLSCDGSSTSGEMSRGDCRWCEPASSSIQEEAHAGINILYLVSSIAKQIIVHSRSLRRTGDAKRLMRRLMALVVGREWRHSF